MNEKSNPLVWFEIYVQDMMRARKFYEGVFCTALEKLETDTPEIWAFPMQPERYGCAGALVKMEGICSGGGGTIVYFSCVDCAVEAARAEQFGGRIFREKWSIGQYGFISLVIDTEGNMIGLHSM